MEEIRSIVYGCTLQEAFESCICIQCHKSLAYELTDYSKPELDVWLIDGHCPSCYQKSLTTKSTTKPNQVRYAR